MWRSLGGVVVSALALAACGPGVSTLQLSLQLSDAVFSATGTARIVLSRTDRVSFPVPSEPAAPAGGVLTSNYDFDGDGATDIVVDLQSDYPFDKVNRLALQPSLLSQPLDLWVRAEVYDGLQNTLARLVGDMGSDRRTAALRPGEVTVLDDLEPACVATCASSTAVIRPQAGVSPLDGPLTAVAAGRLRGGARSPDLIAATALANRSDGQPAAGHVRVFLSGSPIAVDGNVDLVGAKAGDQLGAALASGDLDGDGSDDLIIGAPGIDNGRGAVFVLMSTSPWWEQRTIDLAAPPAGVDLRTVHAGPADARLGWSLALFDSDDNGRPDIVAGGPGTAQGAGAIYVIPGGDPKGPAMPLVSGRAGSQLGQSLAASREFLAAGAPLDTDASARAVGAVYTLARAGLGAPSPASALPRWLGAGGNFGSAVGFVDLDGSGTAHVAAGAPTDGLGLVSLRPLPLPGGDSSTTSHTIRIADGARQLGAALTRLPRARGDDLLVGAPGQGPGAAYLVRGRTLRVLPAIQLDGEGRPAAAAFFGSEGMEKLGTFGSVGDFDADGRVDLALATGGSRRVYLVPAP